MVAALSAAESGRKVITEALRQVKKAVGARPTEEVKLHRLDEHSYLQFLKVLQHPDLAVFATATDAGLNSLERVKRHQTMQVSKVRDVLPRMKYEEGRIEVELLASQLESIAPQLYVQLVCQISLLHELVDRCINYFAQRRPGTLREFRWRIDQKNPSRTDFEDAFEKIAPVLLQTRSFRNPFSKVKGFNYNAMTAYEFEEGKGPTYLQDEYGLPEMQGFNVQKLIRGNLAFADSESLEGLQVVDLVASGLRRLLRGGFSDNISVARELGRLFVQAKLGSNAISLVTMAPDGIPTSSHVTRMVKAINASSKRMIL